MLAKETQFHSLSCPCTTNNNSNTIIMHTAEDSSLFVHEWAVFEDTEPSCSNSSDFGQDFVVATPAASSPRRRRRHVPLSSRLPHALESSIEVTSVKSEQLLNASATAKATHRLPRRSGGTSRPSGQVPSLSESSLDAKSMKSEQMLKARVRVSAATTTTVSSHRRSRRPVGDEREPGHATPSSPAKSSRRRNSVSHKTTTILQNDSMMPSCSLVNIIIKDSEHSIATTESSSSGSTPSETHTRRGRSTEDSAHCSPRRSSPRRTRRLLCMPTVGNAKPSITTENACTRRMARRMSQA